MTWRGLLLAVLFVGASAGSLAQGTAADAGRRIYREGLLPSGEPLTAIVANDVQILGTQFSCQSCHGRSGMGASEGAYIVPPIAAQFLFVESPQPRRPAYDVESLARVLREGVTPAGRTLDQLMPRFRLKDDEVAVLAAYLATLTTGNSPGVDDSIIRFATFVTDDVDPAQRAAVLAVLNTFAGEINRETRGDSERWDRGYTPASRLPTAFRTWVLEEWTLSGPPESWDAQMESHYQRAPVFAILNGLSNNSWGPIGRFCERREIPCLLPSTDLPEAGAGDFYTLYFSQGLDLEAGLIARHLQSQPVPRVIQVFCEALAPVRGATVLRGLLQQSTIVTEDLAVDCESPLPVAELAARMSAAPDGAAVLWLRPSQLAGLEQNLPVGRVYLSSTLLEREPPTSLSFVPGPVFMAHPFRLPGKPDPAYRRFRVWAKTRGLEVSEPRLQAQAFFSLLVLNDSVKHMGRFYVRDYVLDMLDHAPGLAAYLPIYPRPTLGPGQRFLTKGGYILPVVDGQPDTQGAAWILP